MAQILLKLGKAKLPFLRTIPNEAVLSKVGCFKKWENNFNRNGTAYFTANLVITTIMFCCLSLG